MFSGRSLWLGIMLRSSPAISRPALGSSSQTRTFRPRVAVPRATDPKDQGGECLPSTRVGEHHATMRHHAAAADDFENLFSRELQKRGMSSTDSMDIPEAEPQPSKDRQGVHNVHAASMACTCRQAASTPLLSLPLQSPLLSRVLSRGPAALVPDPERPLLSTPFLTSSMGRGSVPSLWSMRGSRQVALATFCCTRRYLEAAGSVGPGGGRGLTAPQLLDSGPSHTLPPALIPATQGLIPRVAVLLQLGGSVFLAFLPFMLAFSLLFTGVFAVGAGLYREWGKGDSHWCLAEVWDASGARCKAAGCGGCCGRVTWPRVQLPLFERVLAQSARHTEFLPSKQRSPIFCQGLPGVAPRRTSKREGIFV